MTVEVKMTKGYAFKKELYISIKTTILMTTCVTPIVITKTFRDLKTMSGVGGLGKQSGVIHLF